MKYTIFAPDDQSLVDFYSWLYNLQVRPNPRLIIGCYKGQIETSIIMRSDDFEHMRATTAMVDNQESVMRVSGCNKAYCELVYLDGNADGNTKTGVGRVEFLGSLHEVTPAEALASEAWSYRPDVNGGTYWVAKMGNPDHLIGDDV